MEFRDFLLSALMFVCVAYCASADIIQGCGGFIEASPELIRSRKPTDAKLDYSNITVELCTLDGLVKDRTQCAPNGYYFIPIYDKGSFVIKIKGPEGWSWTPEQVLVAIDQNGCNANEDINFRFTGFTLSGRVVGAVGGKSCSHIKGGPSNVKVELLSSSGDPVSVIYTSPEGLYSFTNINPGKYWLRASRHGLKIEVRGSTEVELGFGNGIVDDIFSVPGYDIRGTVVAQGNPIVGVNVYLYSEDVSEVNCPQGSDNAPQGKRKALCHAVSDADGLFLFKSIPCGAFELVPYYKGENTVFDVSPPFMSLSVQHDHVLVAQMFQVTGFSIGGRVVDGNGHGVDRVKILVDGHERSITDKYGYYKLDQVMSKPYKVEAKKKHYKFELLKDFLVLPNMASIVDIRAVSYDLCGVAQSFSAGYKVKVALTHGPENVKPQVKQVDESGSFCFEVPPSEYRLSAFAATAESTPELLFLPSHVDVTVNSPLLNVTFYQAQVNILGSVSCKEKCNSSVSVTLTRLGGKSKEEKRTLRLTDESSDYLFPNVLPGKYSVQVKRSTPEAISAEDNWCWEKSSINVDVGTEDVKGVVFVQKGYWVNLVSTHDVDAFLSQPDGSHLNLNIKKGSEFICVESPGVHELHFVNSCIFFGSTSIKIDPSNPLPIYLKGEKYLLKGQIHVDTTSLSGVDELPDNLLVDIFNEEDTVYKGMTALLLHNVNDRQSIAVYEYSVWARLGESLKILPYDSRIGGEKRLLFYPRQQKVSVAGDVCQASIPSFTGRLGLYVKGSVSPPLSDVYIRITAAGDSLNTELKKGELAFETSTAEDGLFVGGPLYDDISYTIEALKSGYHVKSLGPYSFSCQKLSQISVHIYTKEDTEELFPSVLLSLSGEDGYRNNSIAGAGGVFVFENLFPGSFYLRPLLKEYAFSPSAQAIELGSGESKELIFEATRVAYSALGTVTLLSGLPKEGISVEARSESKGYYEETVTDSSGNYRLRGLLPDTTFLIRVARKADHDSVEIERSSPNSVAVRIGSEDIRGLDFLVFEQPEITILSGHVEGEKMKELHNHLWVEIKAASDVSRIESSFPLPLSNFFQVKELPKGKHLLQLRSALPSRSLVFESDVVEVDLEKNAQIHVGPLRYRIGTDHRKQELTPAPVYPLIVGVLVIALFVSMPRLKDVYQATMGIWVSGHHATAKKEAKKFVVRKKAY